MDTKYTKLARDLRLTKEANIRARLAKILANLKSGAKPAAAEAKALAASTAKKTTEAATKAKAEASPKVKELWEYIKKHKKGLAVAGGVGAVGGSVG